jgi:hypothetical protein
VEHPAVPVGPVHHLGDGKTVAYHIILIGFCNEAPCKLFLVSEARSTLD